MAQSMNRLQLPKTDSVQALAEFWDKHDVTDFEHALEEVEGPLITAELRIHLDAKEREAVQAGSSRQGDTACLPHR